MSSTLTDARLRHLTIQTIETALAILEEDLGERRGTHRDSEHVQHHPSSRHIIQ